jgi:hypothetical protein
MGEGAESTPAPEARPWKVGPSMVGVRLRPVLHLLSGETPVIGTPGLVTRRG